MLLLLWVDDIIVTGNDSECIKSFRASIAKRFEMKDLGELQWILGMEVKRNREAKLMEINQQGYIELILRRFGMNDCKPIGTQAEGYLESVKIYRDNNRQWIIHRDSILIT